MSLSDYYALLSSLSAALNQPINDLATRINIPIMTALLLGLIGAVAPCQLTTNMSALAFISRRLETQPATRLCGQRRRARPEDIG